MAKLVHGNDAYTALEIAVRTGASDPTYPDEYFRIPFAGESMAVARDQVPEVPEITRSGAVTGLSYGSGHWRGTFTTLMYYNAEWMHNLLCQLMGGTEWLAIDRMPNDTGTPGAPAIGNTHTYLPQSFRCNTAGSRGAITFGVAMRMTKMGPDNEALNTGIEKVLGAYITEATFTHQYGSWPTVTWTVEGPEPTLLDGTGVTPLVHPINHYFVKPGDLSMAPAHPVLPSLYTAWGAANGSVFIDQYTLRVTNNLRFPSRSLNALDTEHNIGHVSTYEVTCDVRVKARQEDWAVASGSPQWLWANLISTATMGFNMRYISAPSLAVHNPPQTPVIDATNNVPYALEICMPSPALVAVSEPIESGGALQLTYSFRGRNALWGAAAAPNSDKRTPVSFQLLISNQDEPAPDTKINSAASGGNDPDATLNT